MVINYYHSTSHHVTTSFFPTLCPAGTSTCQSLLLHSSSTAETSLLPPPLLFPILLVNNLKSFDVHQDFHLPDDHFASLKLHKLRQVAVESGVEHFSTPSHNTRSSILRGADSLCSVGDPTMFLPSSLNLTPTITDRPCAGGKEQQGKLQDLSIQDILTDESISKDSTKVGSENIDPETNVEQQQLHAETQDCEVCEHTEHEAGAPNTQSQSCVSTRSSHRPINCDQLNPQQSSVDRSPFKRNDSVTGASDELNEPPAAEKQTEFPEISSSEDQLTRTNQVENRATTETPLFDHSQNEMQERPADISISLPPCKNTEAAQESPVHNKRGPRSFEGPSEPNTTPSKDGLVENKATCGPYCSQLALKSPPASVNCSFMSHPPSPTPASIPVLPSLGITPHPRTSSPAAPSFSLPPPHSPSTQAVSPPALSPYPSLTCLPPSLPPLSACSHIQESFELPPGSDQCHKVQPAACSNPSSLQLHGSPEPEAPTAEETAEWCAVRRTHTLKVKQNPLYQILFSLES